MTVEVKIPIYEVDGENAPMSETLMILSDGISSRRVRLLYGTRIITLDASSLISAIQKAQAE